MDLIQKDYPYMYARVSAKRAKLYDENDYENMLKMGPNEIARKMEEGQYKKEINDLGSNYSGVQLAELALARNLAREMSELAEMANGTLRKVIETYLRRYEVLIYKRLLRAKKTEGEVDMNSLVMPVGAIKPGKLQELKEAGFHKVKDAISFKDSSVDYQGYIEDEEELSEIEAGLDQAYYDDLTRLAEKVRNDRLKKFVKEEIEYENIKIALRLKRYDLDSEEVEKRLLTTENGRKVEEVLERDFEEALNYVVEEFELDVEPRIESVEHALEVHRLENALKMLHTSPLGLSSILGYVVAKFTEVKNLRMMLRAKETGIQNRETVRSQLVLAK